MKRCLIGCLCFVLLVGLALMGQVRRLRLAGLPRPEPEKGRTGPEGRTAEL